MSPKFPINCSRNVRTRRSVLFIVFFNFLLYSTASSFDVKDVGTIVVSENQASASFYNMIINLHQNKESVRQNIPSWTKEYNSISIKGYHFTCYQTKGNMKKCGVETQYGASEREMNYSGISQFEKLLGNQHFKYSRKFLIQQKDKIHEKLYEWVRNNSNMAASTKLKEIDNVYIVKFNELAFVCWQNSEKLRLRYCEIDKL